MEGPAQTARALHSDLEIKPPLLNLSTNKIYELDPDKYDQHVYKLFLNAPR